MDGIKNERMEIRRERLDAQECKPCPLEGLREEGGGGGGGGGREKKDKYLLMLGEGDGLHLLGFSVPLSLFASFHSSISSLSSISSGNGRWTYALS